MRIPCDTIARLSHVLAAPDSDTDEAFKCFRLEDGKIFASNRHYLVIEEVGGFSGTHYIRPTAQLVEQCKTEATYSSWVDFTPVEALRYTTAVTMLGCSISENIGYWPTVPTDYDKWREMIVDPCRTPVPEPRGHMTLHLPGMVELLHAAPSGVVTLEQNLDPRERPVCVRDSDSAHWVAFFKPHITDGRVHPAAVVPGWCK